MSAYKWHPAADLFPLIEGDEFDALVDSIRTSGLHESVWLYDDPDLGTTLLDGRNRSRACAAAGVPITTRHYRGDDPITFVIDENIKRRHLNSGQLAFVVLGAEKLYAEQAAHRKGRRPAQHEKKLEADLPLISEPFERGPQARDLAAKALGKMPGKKGATSGRVIGQAKRVQKKAPDLAKQVISGEMAIDRADRIIRDREAEDRKVAEAQAEAASQEQQSTVDIRHGDFRDVLHDLTGVDAIITDPPYPAEFLPLLADLAAWADKALKPAGVLAVLMGQTHLPDVYRLLDGYRPYRWTCAYLTEGPGYVSHPRRIQSNWKPLLVYGGGPRIPDVIRSEGSDAQAKSLHRWGQDYGAFHTIVERLTTAGETIADPFMGSGTTLLAGHALGRNVVGCDIDAEAVATSRRRLDG